MKLGAGVYVTALGIFIALGLLGGTGLAVSVAAVAFVASVTALGLVAEREYCERMAGDE